MLKHKETLISKADVNHQMSLQKEATEKTKVQEWERNFN